MVRYEMTYSVLYMYNADIVRLKDEYMLLTFYAHTWYDKKLYMIR